MLTHNRSRIYSIIHDNENCKHEAENTSDDSVVFVRYTCTIVQAVSLANFLHENRLSRNNKIERNARKAFECIILQYVIVWICHKIFHRHIRLRKYIIFQCINSLK